jgi:cellulose synthase/poly-beta-1,6-N-acetylglucosamine synthase-like glycosyltransferase
VARSLARPLERPQSEYEFLVGHLIDASTLARAKEIAARTNVHPHDVLIANGWIKADDYYEALARSCGLPFVPELRAYDMRAPARDATPRQCLANGVLRHRDGPLLFAPDRLRPNQLRNQSGGPGNIAIVPPQRIRRAIYHYYGASFAAAAIDGLKRRRPEQSARSALPRWQIASIVVAVSCLAAAIAIAPLLTIRTISLVLALLFIPIIGFRVAALRYVLSKKRSETPPTPRLSDAELPIYTILVPLFHEAKVLGALVESLRRLDYPATKLDIKLILEEVDSETIRTAYAYDLPGNFEIVVVPELQPRTKPKALNYALPLARGDYLVIYDAEDRPERDQLRKALAAFREGAPNLACVQARLNLYNASETWFTEQFTIEYSALFDGLLPMLARHDLPIPLGGTSNHFRVSALKWLMAWDPYNVTEDADLGMRLARSDYRCGVLDSTTFEEAPLSFMPWLRQRTRWLKGFVQTYLVHLRLPLKLWRELGPGGFLAFQVMVGGTVLSALIHPWFYGLLVFDLARGTFLARPESMLGALFWVLAAGNLIAGYAAAMALGYLTGRARGLRSMFGQVALMPLYWLLVSAAAYRAIWQFVTARFTWEKTEHGVTRQIGNPVHQLDAVGQPRGLPDLKGCQ